MDTGRFLSPDRPKDRRDRIPKGFDPTPGWRPFGAVPLEQESFATRGSLGICVPHLSVPPGPADGLFTSVSQKTCWRTFEQEPLAAT